MHTIVQKAERLNKKDNRVYLVPAPQSLDPEVFSQDEIGYVQEKYRTGKKDFFLFNKLDHWVFVYLLKKGGEPYQRLQTHREKGASLQSVINDQKLNAVVLIGPESQPAEILSFAEGLTLRNYQFLKHKSNPSEKSHSLSSIYVFGKTIQEAHISDLNIRLDAVCRCRDLVNEPLNYLNAPALAKEIESMSKLAGCKVEVLTKKKIESLKMGGLLAVNRGSVDPPTFTIMEWKPDKPVNQKPYVFVGKGVVYDTGGMNIKTGNYMNDMKQDMAGGAAVASAVYAVARAKLPVHVIALIPATDNRTDGNAYVSGDVITMYDGSRVEVVNTDAEGRMLLADALSYAKKYDPALVISIATLTGSAMRAIGIHGIVSMQTKARGEFKALQSSGNEVYERLVEFPLWKEYREELNSEIADIKHLGGSNAGAITAAKFLEHFTDYPYIHMDIAGGAFLDKAAAFNPAGGTGITVRLLYRFLEQKCNEQ